MTLRYHFLLSNHWQWRAELWPRCRSVNSCRLVGLDTGFSRLVHEGTKVTNVPRQQLPASQLIVNRRQLGAWKFPWFASVWPCQVDGQVGRKVQVRIVICVAVVAGSQLAPMPAPITMSAEVAHRTMLGALQEKKHEAQLAPGDEYSLWCCRTCCRPVSLIHVVNVAWLRNPTSQASNPLTTAKGHAE